MTKKKQSLFDDPYFRGLTPTQVIELAKKSFRLMDQHYKDEKKIEMLANVLNYLADWMRFGNPGNTDRTIAQHIEDMLEKAGGK